MNGSDFITVASGIASNNACPAGYRSAVSRSYYGCFHLAKATLNGFGWYCPKGNNNEHQWVQRHFLNCATTDFMALGKALENLHGSRKQADYDLHVVAANGEPNALASIARAKKLEADLSAASTGASGTALRKEMETYRKNVGL